MKQLDQKKTPIFDAIMKYNEKKPAYFKIPGHRYEKGINQKWRDVVGDAIFQFDMTENPYTDDLHNAEAAIKEAQELAAQVFFAKETYFLVNGTTCGNQAMVMTTAWEGEKIAIPRNAHKSALMGLIMSGAQPIYLTLQIEGEWGLHGGITPEEVERMFQSNPDCRGVMVVSPTYYGLCSPLHKIAEICHRHQAVLIVDEAHGAHCYFSGQLPEGGICQGADMVTQSIHKVTGSLTQSSMLHVRSDLVDQKRLKANLRLVQSTSPNYLLLTSLDMARNDLAMRGTEMIETALTLSRYARTEINKIRGIRCAGKELIGRAGISAMDETRLIISARELGIKGFELEKMLFEKYNCDVELSDYNNILAIITFANETRDVERLIQALREIALCFSKGKPLLQGEKLPGNPPVILSPRAAYFARTETVKWNDAKGRVAAEMLAPYPPGIPVIYPGEQMSEEVWNFVEGYRKRKGHLHGPADPNLDTFVVVKK